MEDGARVFDLHFTPAANDAPARIQIAIVGGACVVDGALLLADACASPEELDAQVDWLTAALAQLKSASRRRFAAAANADSPEWRERFAFMGLPEGARSWRGRLALHLVAQADAWHGLHQDAAQAPAEVLAGAQIAQIGEHTRLGRDFEALRPGQAQRQVQRLLAAVLADLRVLRAAARRRSAARPLRALALCLRHGRGAAVDTPAPYRPARSVIGAGLPAQGVARAGRAAGARDRTGIAAAGRDDVAGGDGAAPARAGRDLSWLCDIPMAEAASPRPACAPASAF